VGHARERENGLRIDSFPIKARENRRGRGAVETSIVKTKSDLNSVGQKSSQAENMKEIAPAKLFKMDVSLLIVKRKAGSGATQTPSPVATLAENIETCNFRAE
jgi:hypothetical protein